MFFILWLTDNNSDKNVIRTTLIYILRLLQHIGYILFYAIEIQEANLSSLVQNNALYHPASHPLFFRNLNMKFTCSTQPRSKSIE